MLKTKMLCDEAMQALHRMNVTNATPFPGLDGTPRSLAYELEQHWVFDPKIFKARPGDERVFDGLKAKGVPEEWEASALGQDSTSPSA